jgi:hypothetical protein
MVANGAVVSAIASAQRGVARLDLWLNGYKWATAKGAAFGSNGQAESTYSLLFPSGVPDGIIDVVVKAYDDIEVETVAPTVTVTKGAPCVDASTCALGQSCEDGRCFWDTPTGEIGDACEYEQFCVSAQCVQTTEGRVCSQDCVVGVADSCPMGFVCEGAAGNVGFCLAEIEDTGCCSSRSDPRGALLLCLPVLGLVLRRRRKRHA